MDNNFQIDDRIFNVKKPTLQFYCPLCSTKRNISYHSKLSSKNYVQVIMLSIVVTLCLYPIMEFRGVFLSFFIWGGFEIVIRMLFKKNIPCPHCGFDAMWYKKDVGIAKSKVQEFWSVKNDSSDSKNDSLQENV